MSEPTIASALRAARARLEGLHGGGTLDTEVLLAHVLGRGRSYLRAWPERRLTRPEREAYDRLVDRRERGEPVAYLTGTREFWGLELEVTPATLVPRPETELLVEQTLALLPDRPGLRVADLGTGSGAVALAIARERPSWTVAATDVSVAALAVARANARRLGVTNVEFHQGNWLTPLGRRRFHAIVGNPPYIARSDACLHRGDLPFEPQVALTPGPSGLEAIHEIIVAALPVLEAGGWLLLEHGYDQGRPVTAALRAAGYEQVFDCPDLAGRDRVARGRRAGPPVP